MSRAHTTTLMFSSARADWETPTVLFQALHREFTFDLDAAASEENALLDTFLTIADDALTCDWPGKRAFLNSPYGRGKTGWNWISRAHQQVSEKKVQIAVLLLAARTDTSWMHRIIMPYADEVRLIQGRLIHTIGGKPALDAKGRPTPAGHPSMVVVFRKKPKYRLAYGPKFRSITTVGAMTKHAAAT